MGGLGGATSIHEITNSNHKPIVMKGIMEKDCLQLIQSFFKLRRENSNPNLL